MPSAPHALFSGQVLKSLDPAGVSRPPAIKPAYRLNLVNQFLLHQQKGLAGKPRRQDSAWPTGVCPDVG
jgi:hypothetical protein